MNFIKDVNDPFMKVNLTDKIPTLLIGAYKVSEKSCKQYLDEVFTDKKIKNKEKMIHIFTEKFLSHRYPMHREFLVKNNIALINQDDALENLIYDLYDECVVYCKQLCKQLSNADHRCMEKILLIQSTDHQLIMVQDEEIK